MDEKNLAVVRQSFANTVFTHKVQEIAAENQWKKVLIVKISNIVLVVFVLIMLVVQLIDVENLIWSYWGASLTLVEIVFLIIQLTFQFEDKMTSHKSIALKYLGLRDKYRNLIADITNGLSGTKIVERRNALQREYEVISGLAPQTARKEYHEAQKRLNKQGVLEGEDFTWSDEEIDRFLPETLRLTR